MPPKGRVPEGWARHSLPAYASFYLHCLAAGNIQCRQCVWDCAKCSGNCSFAKQRQVPTSGITSRVFAWAELCGTACWQGGHAVPMAEGELWGARVGVGGQVIGAQAPGDEKGRESKSRGSGLEIWEQGCRVHTDKKNGMKVPLPPPHLPAAAADSTAALETCNSQSALYSMTQTACAHCLLLLLSTYWSQKLQGRRKGRMRGPPWVQSSHFIPLILGSRALCS